MFHKNEKEHKEDMLTVVENVLKSDDYITVVTGDNKNIMFNKYLLVLFSKRMRSFLASLSCCKDPVILLPDFSIKAVSDVQDILEKQFGMNEGKTVNDIETLEVADILGIDIAYFRTPLHPKAKLGEDEEDFKSSEEKEVEYKDVTKTPIIDSNDFKQFLDKKYHPAKDLAEWSDSSDEEEVLDYDENDYDDEIPDDGFDTVSESVYPGKNLFGEHHLNKADFKNEEQLTDKDISNKIQIKDKNATNKDVKTKYEMKEISNIKTETEIPDQKDVQMEEPVSVHGENEYMKRFRCTLCNNFMRKLTVSTFKEHYSTAHFPREISEMFMKKSENICRVDGCGKKFQVKDKSRMIRHIGSTHNKVVEIMHLKGMAVPAVFTETSLGWKRRRSDAGGENHRKMKVEGGKTGFECLMCGLAYSSKSNMERHMMRNHKLSDLKKLQSNFV